MRLFDSYFHLSNGENNAEKHQQNHTQTCLEQCQAQQGQPAWVPAPGQRFGLSLAQLGSHAHPQTNQGSPGWPGLCQRPPLDLGAWPGPSEPQELDHPGQDVAQRDNTLVFAARGIRATRKRKNNHRHCFPALARAAHTRPVRWGRLLPQVGRRGSTERVQRLPMTSGEGKISGDCPHHRPP